MVPAKIFSTTEKKGVQVAVSPSQLQWTRYRHPDPTVTGTKGRRSSNLSEGVFPRDTHRGGARHACVGGRATPRRAAGDKVCVPPAVATGFRRPRAPRSASPVAKNSPAEFIHTVGWTVNFFFFNASPSLVSVVLKINQWVLNWK
ncbi:hypothetical protein CEXT_785711 [Caerostris extrusa]|uniref:Uncharacterized protein n=1 Tax=Caerostris extrusa TaxID=172846 RepID=A0AAV4MIE3_CAEEX|nr:hypothetical protein CEXT_785711 [Caerostris extrusa]